MGRSALFSLYLLAARRGGSAVADRPLRPEGALVWLHAGSETSSAGLGHLARRMQRERPGLRFLLTAAGGAPDPAAFPADTLTDTAPPDRLPALHDFLGHWRPDLVVLTGDTVPPALVECCRGRTLPVILADARRPETPPARWLPSRRLTGAALPRLSRILAQDPGAADYYRQLGGRGALIEMTVRIEETSEPLSCTEAERDSIAALLSARPVWLAVGCPPAEEEAVIAAHAHALRFAHRLLLILVPTAAVRATALAERLAREGWSVALRSREEEPETETQVFITDGESELGLWYRLAPVTFMGGTLAEGGGGRSPMEPAALGSAILHGPHTAPYPEAYTRLAGARAARRVGSPEDLADAVADLLSPDKAALLAHNAWAASSGGAEVTERVMQILLSELDRSAAPAPPPSPPAPRTR